MATGRAVVLVGFGGLVVWARALGLSWVVVGWVLGTGYRLWASDLYPLDIAGHGAGISCDISGVVVGLMGVRESTRVVGHD